MQVISLLAFSCCLSVCLGALTFTRGKTDQNTKDAVYAAVKEFVAFYNKMSGRSEYYAALEIGSIATTEQSNGIEVETKVKLALTQCNNDASNQGKPLGDCKPKQTGEAVLCSIKGLVSTDDSSIIFDHVACEESGMKVHCHPDHLLLHDKHDIGNSGEFEAFKMKFGKKYPSVQEESYRQTVFQYNMGCSFVLHKTDLGSLKYGFNIFADMTAEEFKAKYLGALPATVNHLNVSKLAVSDSYKASIPECVDWRTKGVVTPVRNQGYCGSCWAHAVTCAVEIQHAIDKKATPTFLSPQQLVDCLKSTGGCHGGWPQKAMTEIIAQGGGIMREDQYKYEARELGECKKTNQFYSFLASYQKFEETTAAEFVANRGPLSACINWDNLKGYTGGVYNPPAGTCPIYSTHVVTIVGYCKENGVAHWIAKNSHGTGFGESGYFRIAANINACGIGYDLLGASLK